MKRLFLTLCLLLCLTVSGQAVFAQPAPGLLIPMGGGYSDVYAGFSAAAVANARDGQVKILVLPAPYSSNPLSISGSERQTNIRDAEQRRFQIEEACKRAAPQALTCTAILIPVFTREDASDPATLSLIPDDLSAVFTLGGDQTVAMQAIAGTPLEARLSELHAQGVIFAGTSAGGGMLSRTMLGGYNLNYAAESALFFGAPDVWNTADRHGLPFGLQTAILDQHFYQRARFGRLLNAILMPDVPHLGVGVDAYTGVIAEGEVLRDVFGLYTVTILDAETYHAAEGVRYVSIGAPMPLLSARNVLVHLLSPGEARYDLKARRHSLADPAPKVERDFVALAIPQDAGSLILAGDLSKSLENNPVLARFVAVSGGEQASLIVVVEGGASASAKERLAQKYVSALQALGAQVQTWTPDASGAYPQPPSPDVTGFVFVSKDASKTNPPLWLKEHWLAGKSVLADNAGASLMGAYYAAHGPTPDDAEQAELATQKSFWKDKTEIRAGVGLVNLTLEPQILADNRFGRWFSLAYTHPEMLAVGLNQGTAIEFSPEGATVLGTNGVFVLDLRTAKLGLGSNDGFVVANGLLDVFAPGETLQPEVADIDASYQTQPTPVLQTPTPSMPTASPTVAAAPTPSAEATPTLAAQAQAPSEPSAAGWVWIGIGILILLTAAWRYWARKRSKPS